MTSLPDLDQMTPEQLRTLAAQLMSKVDTQSRKIHRDETIIEQLTHEIAILKRHKFAKRSEQISPAQGSLLDDLLNTDLEAIEAELKALHPAPAQTEPRQQPKRAPLPPQFPRTVIRHEPESTQCACGCQLQRVGEDISEKLDYTPGVFTVEQHVRGKWACRQCETLIQAPVPAHVIDKGIPTAGLLAHVMVAKFSDHLPLYRQEKIFGRAGLMIARSTLAQWVGQTGVQLQPLVDALREAVLAEGVIHADETPVQMLAPGEKKTHRAYVWAYSTTPFSALKAVVYDFSPSRAGEHARNFLGPWNGKLVCDDFAGYKAGFGKGMTEIGCMAHARRKFFDLHVANKSKLAEKALLSIGGLYEVERQAKDMSDEDRRRIRQERAAPIIKTLQDWMLAQRDLVPNGSATAKALDYSLKRWVALTRYLDDGAVPIDNNQVENQIRPWALGRSNWLFAGSLRNGKRAAAIMSLIQSARMNGHDPYAYLKDVLTRLPTQRASDATNLLPHRWAPV
ncbi:IS66 family transposase [Pseudomonas sp. CCUG 57209]|uniref:IS66 family transposase n=1 Tax=Pseudomonas sivasensis TaxID=1880678 RepID=UPI0015EC3197|nr:IS66 family transposase [Pseudomonas sivasensis]MBA2931669.1 IS66 family transposase [Pseudomonas sivasensis]